MENESQRKLKFTKADLDVDMSMLAIGIDEGQPQQQLEKTQDKITGVREEVDNTLTQTYQANKGHRVELQNQMAAMRADETEAVKAIEKHDSEFNRLNTAVAEKAPNAGKWLLGLPILDAFGGPLKPQQMWLPDLPWNNNFRNVARFDRCVTCHQGIDKTAPGSAVDPAYPHAEEVVLEMATPKAEPGAEWYAKSTNERLYNLYGMHLSETSLFGIDDVTIGAVFPGGAAIKSGMRAGDVLVKVGGTMLTDKTMAPEYLLQSVTWGKPLRADHPPRRAGTVCDAPASGSVRRLDEPAQGRRVRLHDLPRRAGERHVVQLDLAHAQRSAASRRLEARTRVVQQPPLDLPDAAEPVPRSELLEVPPRADRAEAERAFPGSSGSEAHGRLRDD
ncbi:MAG: PDZ domain-containing protein [Pirellulales bacterium]